MTKNLLFAFECGTGTPLVVLHGLTIDHRMMLPLDPIVTSTGDWRRHYLDLPGHGRSAHVSPTTTDELVAMVANYIRQAIGDRPFAVMGASFGGGVAVALTDMLGDQVLGSALLAPAVMPRQHRTLPSDIVSNADESLLATLSVADRSAFTFVTAQQDLAQWSLFQEHIRPGLLAHDQSAVAELTASPADLSRSRPRAHFGEHLIITGKQDAVVGWSDQQRLLDCYPHATYAALERCGHNVHLERPLAVDALLTEWLHALRE